MENLLLGSTIVFAPFSLDLALEGLAEAGYKNCEIGAVKGWFEHIDPDTITDAEIHRVEAKLQALGLRPVSLSGHTQLQTEAGKERLKRAIEIAAALDMQVINTYTGDAVTEAERDAFYANVEEICDHAKRHGLKVGLETDSNLLPTAQAGVEILERIGRPDVLGFNYDPGNVVYYAGADPYEDIVHALSRLVHFHFKDKIGGKGVFNFPPVGDGDLDMPRLLKIALDGGYRGPVSAEVEFDDAGWPDYDGCRAAARKTVANLHAMDIAW